MDKPTIKSSKASKYEQEEISSDKEEYKFVKSFFDTTKNVFRRKSSPKEFKVFKITENNPLTTLNDKRNNLMLFHGTTMKGVEGILKQGFKNSKKGWFGQGVYMTDCSDKAQDYCTDDDDDCGDCYIFVNEVLNSEKL